METQKELSEKLRGQSYTGESVHEEIQNKQSSNQVSRRDDETKALTVGLNDIDFAIHYYFTKVIQPTVMSNGVSMQVPVEYANPEKWQAIQKEGFYRDKEGKRQVPVIVFKRDNLEKDRSITSKIDANNPHNYYISKRAYTSRNTYLDQYNPIAFKNRLPEEASIITVVPDYVKIQYSCTILTDLMSQMNPIIEAINFASDSYWGEENRFKFQSFVDSFKTDIQANTDEDRTVRTTFGIKLNGYILPRNPVNSSAYVNFKRYRKTHTSVKITESIL